MRVDSRPLLPILELVLVCRPSDVVQGSNPKYCLDIYGPCHLTSMFLPVLYYCKMDGMCKIHIHEFLNEGEVLDSLPGPLA